MLRFDEYQKQSYIACQEHADNKEEIMHWSIGLAEEAGEVLGVFKHRYYGGEYTLEDAVEELGDVLWYISALCNALGVQMEDVAAYNLAKLQYRYPTAEFDAERSQARHAIGAQFRTSVERAQAWDNVRANHQKEEAK